MLTINSIVLHWICNFSYFLLYLKVRFIANTVKHFCTMGPKRLYWIVSSVQSHTSRGRPRHQRFVPSIQSFSLLELIVVFPGDWTRWNFTDRIPQQMNEIWLKLTGRLISVLLPVGHDWGPHQRISRLVLIVTSWPQRTVIWRYLNLTIWRFLDGAVNAWERQSIPSNWCTTLVFTWGKHAAAAAASHCPHWEMVHWGPLVDSQIAAVVKPIGVALIQVSGSGNLVRGVLHQTVWRLWQEVMHGLLRIWLLGNPLLILQLCPLRELLLC